MLKRKLLLGAMIAASLYAVPQSAVAAFEIYYTDRSPPAVRMERVPASRAGYDWAPGHWAWRNNRHVWVKGRFVRERSGYTYYAPRWVQHDNRWRYEGEGWNRGRGDRDRDGIPNALDRDRDGDGVPNRRDSNPNNPNRN